MLLGANTLVSADVGDYVVNPPSQELPPRGLLGIFMKENEQGVAVADFSPESPARKAGLRKGDRLRAIDGRPVHGTADVRLALLDARPGQAVTVEIERSSGTGTERHRFTVTLSAEPPARR